MNEEKEEGIITKEEEEEESQEEEEDNEQREQVGTQNADNLQAQDLDSQIQNQQQQLSQTKVKIEEEQEPQKLQPKQIKDSHENTDKQSECKHQNSNATNPIIPVVTTQNKSILNNIQQQSVQLVSQADILNAMSLIQAPQNNNNNNNNNQIALIDIYPQYDRNFQYYQEFWRVYLANEILITQMKDEVAEIRQIKEKINQTEAYNRAISIDNDDSQQKKKNRRTANQIEKKFDCPYAECGKQYGSEVSLNLHIKLKHGGGNKTEREKAQAQGIIVPNHDLNLPPGYLQALGQIEQAKLNEDQQQQQQNQQFRSLDNNVQPIHEDQMQKNYEGNELQPNTNIQEQELDEFDDNGAVNGQQDGDEEEEEEIHENWVQNQSKNIK